MIEIYNSDLQIAYEIQMRRGWHAERAGDARWYVPLWNDHDFIRGELWLSYLDVCHQPTPIHALIKAEEWLLAQEKPA
jgi:hypothetical protein